MTSEVRWTPTALARITEITDYFAQHDLRAARRTADQIFARMDRLADHPYLGPPHPLLHDPAIRRLVAGSHVVSYRVDEEDASVTILTVRHGRQDGYADIDDR